MQKKADEDQNGEYAEREGKTCRVCDLPDHRRPNVIAEPAGIDFVRFAFE